MCGCNSEVIDDDLFRATFAFVATCQCNRHQEENPATLPEKNGRAGMADCYCWNLYAGRRNSRVAPPPGIADNTDDAETEHGKAGRLGSASDRGAVHLPQEPSGRPGCLAVGEFEVIIARARSVHS